MGQTALGAAQLVPERADGRDYYQVGPTVSFLGNEHRNCWPPGPSVWPSYVRFRLDDHGL
jgi:hypothetical protein